eukprot:scaffold395479_cov53-Prasinocladus_malaysianus.AAC.1
MPRCRQALSYSARRPLACPQQLSGANSRSISECDWLQNSLVYLHYDDRFDVVSLTILLLEDVTFESLLFLHP